MQLISAQLTAATTALRSVLSMEYPADSVLRRYFRENHLLGANDRAFVAETVFGILRHKYYLECLMDLATPRALLLAYLAKFQGVHLRELTPHASESEIKWLTQIKSMTVSTQPLAVQAEFPVWLVEKLQAFMPEAEILDLGRSLQLPASLDLRVNTIHAKRDSVLETLKQQGFEAEATPYSPVGIRVKGKPAINRHDLFLNGHIEVQDEGSQILGYLLAPKRGDMVVDFCAGAGGKTLLLGALMNSKGRLYALDTSEKRLNNLKPRLKRSGLSNIHSQRISNENDLKVKRLAGKIDRVLVDAPCSGLGTLRRNPDLKWRQSPESVQELKQKQAAILAASANLLKPGGRLVYATCSFLPEENQEIIEQFLASHPKFSLLNCTELLAQQKIPLETGEFLRLSPKSHGTDGFFAAALTIKKDEPPKEEPKPEPEEEPVKTEEKKPVKTKKKAPAKTATKKTAKVVEEEPVKTENKKSAKAEVAETESESKPKEVVAKAKKSKSKEAPVKTEKPKTKKAPAKAKALKVAKPRKSSTKTEESKPVKKKAAVAKKKTAKAEKKDE